MFPSNSISALNKATKQQICPKKHQLICAKKSGNEAAVSSAVNGTKPQERRPGKKQ
jgi:hypothetical protein